MRIATDIVEKAEAEYARAKKVHERLQTPDTIAALSAAQAYSKELAVRWNEAHDILRNAEHGNRLTVIKGIVVTTSKTTPDDLVKMADGHAAMKKRFYRGLRLR